MSRSLKLLTRPLRRYLAGALYSRARVESATLRVVGDGHEFARLSFSGRGEDMVAIMALQEMGVAADAITYLDVGAAHPVRLSNTYAAYCLGARGVLVEPDPDEAALLRARRPRDTVVQAGIAADERRSGVLVRFTDRVFNTIDEAQAQRVVESSRGWAYAGNQAIVDRVPVALTPINEIIERQLGGRAPDFLSIDTEGGDFAILASLDAGRFRPRVICVERSTGRATFEELLAPRGYALLYRNCDNLVYALSD